MKTEKRISELAKAVLILRNYINHNVVVSDIATDHGYLAELLSKQEWIKKVIATDISKKCLYKLVNLIEVNKLKKIETLIGDGLEPIGKVDICVIAGVGGFEIIKMLKNQNLTSKNTTKCNLFVLQPAQNIVELREWIFDNKFFVINDYVIEDAGRFYPIVIVDVSKTQINEKNIFNLWLGRDNNLSSKDFKLFLKDSLEFLLFLDNLSLERIERDNLLKQKYELKQIIVDLLNE